jgi:pimeloyl-ACP methyl ester carboxylesterase
LRSARTPRAVGQVAMQLLGSLYIAFFLCPGVPELAFRSRLGVLVHQALERIGGSGGRPAPPRSITDYVTGLKLYRANMPGPMVSPGPHLPRTTVAVQTLVPRRDIFVTPALQRFTGSIPPGGRVIPIEGGHWVVTSRPEVIAELTAEWVDQHVNA